MYSTYPWCRFLRLERINNLVMFHVSDLWLPPDTFNDVTRKRAGIALNVRVPNVVQTAIAHQGRLLLGILQKAEVRAKRSRLNALLEHDDIGVVDNAVRGQARVMQRSHIVWPIIPQGRAIW